MHSTCPGCGLTLPKSDGPIESRVNASAECLQLRNELAFYTLRNTDLFFFHQVAVDCYAAQHFKEGAPRIGLAFALIGLCLLLEFGYTGKEVQEAHKRLADKSKEWPAFTMPSMRGEMTVADVLKASAGPDRDSALIAWAASIWKAYEGEQEKVREVLRKFGEI